MEDKYIIMGNVMIINNIKQILQMSQSGPAPKPSFQTPARTSKTTTKVQSNIKYSSPLGIEPKNYLLSTSNNVYANTASSAKKPQYRSESNQINIKISQKLIKPYRQRQADHTYENKQINNLSKQQLVQVVQTYQQQIQLLQEYIHKSDLLQRQKIVQIFGLNYSNCPYNPHILPTKSQQSKQVLKQLSLKVKSLIQQNTKLKQSRAYSVQDFNRTQDHLLLKQNQKLRMIIDQYKNTENDQLIKLRSEVYKLRIENEGANQMNKRYRSRIDAYEENSKYRDNKMYDQPKPSQKQNITQRQQDVQRLRQLQKQIQQRDRIIRNLQRDIKHQKQQPIVPQIKPIKQDFNTVIINPPKTINLSQQQIQYAKKQMTKQMFQFSQQLQLKNKKNESKISQLQKKVQYVQSKLKQYERQRKMKIDSTMRKSFILTQSIMKLKGDVQADGPLADDDAGGYKKEEGKIVYKNKLIFKKQQNQPNNNFVDQNFTFRNRNTQPQFSPPAPANNPNSNIITNTATVTTNNQVPALKQQLRQITQRLLMQQLKNKNLCQQHKMLKKQLQQSQAKKMQKIQRNILLQALITKLQTENKQLSIKSVQNQKNQNNSNNQELEQELKLIRQTLLACNINNFDAFFKQFNDILQQRKILATTIQEYQQATEKLSKSRLKNNPKYSKEQNSNEGILKQKINQLIEQNNRLINKITQLQRQIDGYHQQIINNQIQKLNNIRFDQLLNPTGQNAIEWQKKVKASIEGCLQRLEGLEKKIINMERQKTKNQPKQKVLEDTAQKETKISSHVVQYSSYRRLGGNR